MIDLLNCDCMQYMETLTDNAFDLALVDPPYGVKNKNGNMKGILTKETVGLYKLFKNIPPKDDYFNELFRISKNQIIFGGNYFRLPISRGWIYWNKQTPTNVFADGELAWTSFDRNLKCFDYMWTNIKEGYGKGFKSNKPANIHPTQKPVALYDWILRNYAKPGQRIIDTHLGSGSSAIAAYYFKCDFVGCEIDVDYFNAAKERFDRKTRQSVLY